jgi:hypothetical protein
MNKSEISLDRCWHVKNILNYWTTRYDAVEQVRNKYNYVCSGVPHESIFLGFIIADITNGSPIGLNISDNLCLLPVNIRVEGPDYMIMDKLRLDYFGLSDKDIIWTLMLTGIDDYHYVKIFKSKDLALEYIKSYILKDKILIIDENLKDNWRGWN